MTFVAQLRGTQGRFLLVPLLALVTTVACGKSENPGSDPKGNSPKVEVSIKKDQPAASVSASTVASTSTKPVEPKPVGPTKQMVLAAIVGKDTKLRMFVRRAAGTLTGTYMPEAGGGATRLRGTVSAEDAFKLEELDAKGKPTGIFEGSFAGEVMKGTWRSLDGKGKSKPKPFTTNKVSSPFTGEEAAFEHSFSGSIGAKARVRAKIKRDGEVLTGVYRYARSRSELVLAGTVAADGTFEMKETAGTKTSGVFKGAFLSSFYVVGTWSNVEGDKNLEFTLEGSDTYPETVALFSGARIIPQEEHSEKGKACTSSVVYPEIEGLPKKEVNKTLNALLKKQSGANPLGKSDCDGATEDLPYTSEGNYAIGGKKAPYFGLVVTSYGYYGGAHGNHGIACLVVDTEKGTTSELGKSLSAEGLEKLASLVNEKLKVEHKVENLTDAGFFEDPVKVTADTTLCYVADGSVEVTYQTYEVTPYVMGNPVVKISAAEIKPLFSAGSVGETLFK